MGPGAEPATSIDLEAVPCGVLSFSAEGMVTYANAAARQILAPARAPLEGRPFDELLSPGARAYLQLMLRPKLDLDGSAEEVALVLRTDDGLDVHVLANLVVRGPGGRRRTDCAFVRLRQRKALEDRLLRMSRAVDQMPGILFRLLAGPGDTVRLQHAGAGLAELTGLTQAELFATPGRLASMIDPADLPGLLVQLDAARRTGTVAPLTLRLQPPDQPARWVRVHASAHPQGGRDVVWQGIVYDITRQRQIDERLRNVDKLQAVATLASGVAHDFNNLLGSIIGLTDLCQRQAEPGSRQLRNLDRIQLAARQASTLVRQLLDFSRQTPQRFETTTLDAILGGIEPLLRAGIPAGVDLQIRVEAAPPVSVDAVQIGQSLLNLVRNATHAVADRPDGRIEVVVDEVDAPGDPDPPAVAARACRVRVIDNGHGIDAPTLARIFEPFFTTKPVGEGTGLGLAAVHGVIAAHAGHVGVDTAPGRGATFSLYLPRADEGAGAPPR